MTYEMLVFLEKDDAGESVPEKDTLLYVTDIEFKVTDGKYYQRPYAKITLAEVSLGDVI